MFQVKRSVANVLESIKVQSLVSIKKIIHAKELSETQKLRIQIHTLLTTQKINYNLEN